MAPYPVKVSDTLSLAVHQFHPGFLLSLRRSFHFRCLSKNKHWTDSDASVADVQSTLRLPVSVLVWKAFFLEKKKRERECLPICVASLALITSRVHKNSSYVLLITCTEGRVCWLDKHVHATCKRVCLSCTVLIGASLSEPHQTSGWPSSLAAILDRRRRRTVNF